MPSGFWVSDHRLLPNAKMEKEIFRKVGKLFCNWKKKKIKKENKNISESKSKNSGPPFSPIDILKLLVKALINHTTSKICVNNKIKTDSTARLFLNIGCVITVIKVNSDYLSCLLIFSWADNYRYTKWHSKRKFGASFTDALTSFIWQEKATHIKF